MKSDRHAIHGVQRMYFRKFFVSALIPIIVLSVSLSLDYIHRSLDFHKDSVSDVLNTSVSMVEKNFSELETISFTPYLYGDIEQAIRYMYNGYFHPDADPSPYFHVSKSEANYTVLITKMLHTSFQKVQSISFYPFGNGYGDAYTIERDTAGLQYGTIDTDCLEDLRQQLLPYDTMSYLVKSPGKAEGSYSLLRLIRDIDAKKDLGILRIDAGTEGLQKSVQNISLTKHSGLCLIDPEGNIVHTLGASDDTLIDATLQHKKSIFHNLHIYEFQVKEILGWKLVHISSIDDICSSFTVSIFLVFAAVVLAFALTYLLYRLQSARTIKSIRSICQATRQLQQGNLNYTCSVDGDKQFEPIANALNEMGQNLKVLIQSEAEARECQSRAEFTALQSQINPHFLYNTLNGFIALNRMGERKQLETSILQLTKLFRHICSRSDTVTVEQEFRFATQYLELQRLRFDDRINYNIDMEENTAQQPIPKLLIQPLIENCVVHGMEESDAPINITLHAKIAQDTLILEVIDTGIGFDVSILGNSTRVGFKNVLNRLRLFRQESDYEVKSAPRKGTTVRLLIPLEASLEDKNDDNSIG